jgi:hypothetical protein
LSLDYLGKGEWGKARECLDHIGLLSRKKDEGWFKYLQFRGDWEKMMGALKKEEVNEMLKDCWV